MTATVPVMEAVLRRVADTLIERSAELDELDAALAGGDHGRNLAAVARRLRERAPALAALPLPEALAAVAELLEREGSGAAAHYYAVFLAAMAPLVPVEPKRAADLLPGFEAGMLALERAGAAPPGGKSLVDVLHALQRALAWYGEGTDRERVEARLMAAAGHAMHQTRYREAKWEPAAGLGPRSIEHMDAGACSAALILGAVLDALDAR
ncbi:PTS-dependent dihydroxyacetone kinase, ADP-binding subunit DhaL [bacterium HR39]|nr:PTS-dependent dihydroxyacetone kinase, ADP-binding subunit DhaL [bacterium HR39]